MPSGSPRFVWARAQGLLPALGTASGAVLLGLLFGAELVGIPGLVDPIPAVRVFPAVIAASGALVLLEPWHTYEVTGAWPLQRHRMNRYVLGLSIALGAGYLLSANAGSRAILVIGVLFYAAFALAIGLIGKFWWIAAAAAIYGQLFIRDYDRFDPRPGQLVAALIVAWLVYLARGESSIGRSPT